MLPGCWHELSLRFLCGSVNTEVISSPLTAVYNPKAFIPHAASLRQTFVHCGRFSTAATRRCLGSVSVPVRRATLSRPLPIFALVSRYLTNKLIGRRPSPGNKSLVRRHHPALPSLSVASPRRDRPRYSGPEGRYLCVTLPFAAYPRKGSLDLHA